ncbi:response regulator [Mycobacterium sp. NPDC051804]|uniref:response regulator n=1 Tax=Mycobacterium sp. NPDC051804 TaxID=3364295 RepID=UPI0037B6D478
MESGAVDVRCVIVDDNPGFLITASKLLDRQGLSVVAVATSSAEALEYVEQQHPDVTIVDLKLGEESGFRLAEQIVNGPVPSQVILTSTHSESEYGELIAASPALGFIPKERLSPEAIRRMVEAGRRG